MRRRCGRCAGVHTVCNGYARSIVTRECTCISIVQKVRAELWGHGGVQPTTWPWVRRSGGGRRGRVFHGWRRRGQQGAPDERDDGPHRDGAEEHGERARDRVLLGPVAASQYRAAVATAAQLKAKAQVLGMN